MNVISRWLAVLGGVAILAVVGGVCEAQTGVRPQAAKTKSGHVSTSDNHGNKKAAGPVKVTKTIQTTEPAAVQKLVSEVAAKAIRQASPRQSHSKIKKIENFSVHVTFGANSTTAVATVKAVK